MIIIIMIMIMIMIIIIIIIIIIIMYWAINNVNFLIAHYNDKNLKI